MIFFFFYHFYVVIVVLTLQVIARDEESGEEVSASVDIEVLQRGQAGESKNTHVDVWTHVNTHRIEAVPYRLHTAGLTSCGGAVSRDK